MSKILQITLLIFIKINNLLAKFMFLCIEATKKGESYKIRAIIRCKNKEDQQNFISNTINLIVE